MKTQTQSLLELWLEARTRFTNQLPELSQEDLKKKLHPAQNSVGFLIRHVSDVELLFAKNVFGASDLSVRAKTVIAQRDTGEWTKLEELLTYADHSSAALKGIIEKQSDTDWGALVKTNEFGVKTKAEALGRIVSHTAHHGGQMAIVLKYGKP